MKFSPISYEIGPILWFRCSQVSSCSSASSFFKNILRFKLLVIDSCQNQAGTAFTLELFKFEKSSENRKYVW